MKKRGFTLVELLAVIVILGIIMLIATPMIMNVIEDSKRKAFEISAGNIVRAAETEYWNNTLMGPPKSLEFEYSNGRPVSEVLEFNGKNPENGMIYVDNEGYVAMAIHDGTWCAIKDFDNKNISVEKLSMEDCYVDTVIEYTDVSCFEYDEIKTVESFEINYNACMVFFSNMVGEEAFEEDEELFSEICNGNEINGLTLKDFINFEPEALDALISAGAIYNIQGLKEGIVITDYLEGCPKDIAIPKKINDKNVIVLGGNSFYSKDIESVKIPNSVTQIGAGAFAYNQLSELVIPNSVRVIGMRAFYRNELNKINIRNGVEIIEIGAFEDNLLVEVFIPKSVKTIRLEAFYLNNLVDGNVTIDNCPIDVFIENMAFTNYDEYYILPVFVGENCQELLPEQCFQFNENNRTIYGYNWFLCSMDVVIPDEINGIPVEHIGERAFSAGRELNKLELASTVNSYIAELYPTGITSVRLPNQLKTIKEYAFYGSNLTSVIIPDSVVEIGEYAFSYSYIGQLILGNSIESIGYAAFSDNQLTEVTIPNSVITIGSSVFSYNQLTEVTIPNSVTTISDYAFSYNQLTEVIIPNSVTQIGSFAFSSNQLTEVIIPNNVTTISDYAFYFNQLTEVIIPNSVTTIGSSVFRYNNISQGNAKIDNSAGNVIIGSYVFYNNGPNQNQTITPTYLR